VIEWLLGHPVQIFESGELVWQPGWSLLWVWLALAIVTTGIVASAGYALLRGIPLLRCLCLVVLQLAILGGVAALLCRPIWEVRVSEPGRNSLLALVDHSRSMSFDDGRGPRLAQTLAALEADVLPRITDRFALEAYAFSDALRRIDSLGEPPEYADQTWLLRSVRLGLERARDAGAAALILISDGQDTGSPELQAREAWSRELERMGIPVHVIAAGRERVPEDVAVIDARLPARALRGTRVPVDVTLRHDRGEGDASESVRVVIRDAARPLASTRVDLDPSSPQQNVRLEIEAASPGLYDLEIAVDPLPGERILQNNQVRRLLEIPSQTRRVLYFEGEPRWEFKFLRRAIRGDAAVSVVSMLQTTPSKLLRQGVETAAELAEGFPEDARTLFAFDALVIGSVEASLLSPEQHRLVEAFVRTRGGALLMLGGARGLSAGGWGATALAEAFPVTLPRADRVDAEPRAGRVQPTQLGAATPWLQLAQSAEQNRALWAGLPELPDLQPLGRLKLGAVSLLERLASDSGSARGEASRSGAEREEATRSRADEVDPPAEDPSRSVLALHSYGRGRVAVFGAVSSWRWRMQLPADDRRHRRFWRQLLRQLAGSSAEPARAWIEPVEPGEGAFARRGTQESRAARLRLELRSETYEPIADAEATATLVRETGESRKVELRPSTEVGLYEALVSFERGQLYRIGITHSHGDAEGSLELHHRETSGRDEFTSPRQSRGLLDQIARATGGRVWSLDSLSELPSALVASPRFAARVERYEIAFMPLALLLLISMSTLEWSLRRRWSLP